MFFIALRGIITKFLITGKSMQTFKIILGISCILFLSHCSRYDFSRRATQQGNLLPEAKIQRLKLGMHRNDVAVLMGDSLIPEMFSRNRWDYAYTLKKGNYPLKIRTVRLYFKNDVLSRIESTPAQTN